MNIQQSWHKQSLFLSIFLFVMQWFITVPALAQYNDPLTMLQTTSGEMIKELRANKANLKNDSVLVYGIINRILLPHVDVTGMARSVLGRQVWSAATRTEQEQFTKEFTKLLIRTYAKAFAAYDNQEIKFLPLRESVGANTRIQVDSLILQPDGPKIPVNYRLAKFADGWKAYDIVIDGVSLLQSYRSQFTAEVSQHGLPALTQKLRKQNENVV